MSLSFNEQSEKARFIHRPNPLVERAYQIFEYKADKASYEPVGEYTVIDASEEAEITEKKMINLISLMNGKEKLIELGNLTNTRLLYNIIPDASDNDKQKIVFRTYDGDGVSKENAILIIEKGVFDEF